jgi:hypothetical protein
MPETQGPHETLLTAHRRGMQNKDGAELVQELMFYFLFLEGYSCKGWFQIIYGISPFPKTKKIFSTSYLCLIFFCPCFALLLVDYRKTGSGLAMSGDGQRHALIPSPIQKGSSTWINLDRTRIPNPSLERWRNIIQRVD